jgi:PadR family transcriptional regulator, regulatory protein PadR
MFASLLKQNIIMNAENIQMQMRKGVLEFCILSVIAKNKSYASDIINSLKEAKMLVVEGTIYPLLTRLKNEGVLKYSWEESKTGPPRKYYELTPEGEIILTEMNKTWNELAFAVQSITK